MKFKLHKYSDQNIPLEKLTLWFYQAHCREDADEIEQLEMAIEEILQLSTPEPAPTPGKEATLDIIWELLVENAFVSHTDPIDRNLTFQELGMDSLDITRLVVEVEGRFGIKLDTENVWPTNVAELVNLIPDTKP